MEGAADRPLPEEARSKRPSTKIIAIVVVAILIIAAVAGAVLLMGGGSKGTATASFSVDSDAISAGDAVTFDASASNATEGKVTEYTWNFGDNTNTTTTVPTVTHTYSIPGTIIAGLIVKTDKGAISSQEIARITVNPLKITPDNESAPVAAIFSDLDLSADIVAPSAAGFFDGKNSYAYVWNGTAFETNASAITGYSWVFGDGATGNTVNANHSWATEGIYGVILTVTKAGTVNTTGQAITSIYVKSNTTAVALPRSETYVWATPGQPDNIDPAVDYETAGGEILINTYETLVWYDGNSSVNLKPMLATKVPTVENGGISADGLNYTFEIRQGVKFHSGNVMTPQDVEFSLERVLTINDPNGPAWMMAQVMIPGYGSKWSPVGNETAIANSVTVDGNNVTVHLIQKYPAFLYVMAYTVASVVEKAAVMAHGGVVPETQNAWMNRNDAGTGPYKMIEWVPNQYIRLDRFENYWQGAAALKHVLIREVNDIGTREMLLFSGDADQVFIDRQHKTDVQGRPDVRIIQGLPTFNIDFIGMNQNIKPSNLNVGDIGQYFFSDIHVRRAFAAAFDYSAYINNTMFGTAIQPNGAIPKGMFGYNGSIPLQQYNIAVAQSELGQAVDNRSGHSGSYLSNGFNLTLFYNTGNQVRQAACERLALGLSLVSPKIHVTVVNLEWGTTYLPALYAGQLTCFLLGWAPDYADPDDYVTPFLITGGTYGLTIGLNNATLDKMITDAAAELNETARAEMYSNITWAVYNNTYYIWTDQATNFHVERTWVQGFVYNPMYSPVENYFYELSKSS